MFNDFLHFYKKTSNNTFQRNFKMTRSHHQKKKCDSLFGFLPLLRNFLKNTNFRDFSRKMRKNRKKHEKADFFHKIIENMLKIHTLRVIFFEQTEKNRKLRKNREFFTKKRKFAKKSITFEKNTQSVVPLFVLTHF